MTRLDALISADRRGDAVAYFLTTGPGMPAEVVAGMRHEPFWSSFESIAHTLSYDGTIVGDATGGESCAASALGLRRRPHARHGRRREPRLDPERRVGAHRKSFPMRERRTLEGQDHGPDPKAPRSCTGGVLRRLNGVTWVAERRASGRESRSSRRLVVWKVSGTSTRPNRESSSGSRRRRKATSRSKRSPTPRGYPEGSGWSVCASSPPPLASRLARSSRSRSRAGSRPGPSGTRRGRSGTSFPDPPRSRRRSSRRAPPRSPS